MKKEQNSFTYLFQIPGLVLFGVEYSHPLFSNNKIYIMDIWQNSDYYLSGRFSSNKALKEGTIVREFYDKWYFLQEKDLTEKQYQEIKTDIEELKQNYNYLEMLNDDNYFSEEEIEELIKMELKNKDK